MIMATDLVADPVSSLRAVALSTLKSKRRKPVVERPAPKLERPPPPKEVFQLDYGQEDATADVTMADATSSPTLNESPSGGLETIVPDVVSVQGFNREEGEISDEEEAPGPVSASSRKEQTSIRAVSSSPKPTSPEPRELAEARQVQYTPLRLAATPDSDTLPTTEDPLVYTPNSVISTGILPISLGPNCVRPGLNRELCCSKFSTPSKPFLCLQSAKMNIMPSRTSSLTFLGGVSPLPTSSSVESAGRPFSTSSQSLTSLFLSSLMHLISSLSLPNSGPNLGSWISCHHLSLKEASSRNFQWQL